MKTVNTISFSRKGNLADVKNLVKRHFEAQGYELVKENDTEFIFQKGTVLNRWLSFNPMKWKTLFIVHIETKENTHHFTGELQRLRLTRTEIRQGAKYWEEEINSFRRAVLSEEIIAEENHYLANNEGINTKYSIMIIFIIIGIFFGYFTTFFPFIDIVNYFFKFYKPNNSFSYLSLLFMLLHIIYFRYRYFLVLFCHIPMITVLIFKNLGMKTMFEELGMIATLLLLTFHQRLFLQDVVINTTKYSKNELLLKKEKIGDIVSKGFIFIRDYSLLKQFWYTVFIDPNKISYKDLFSYHKDFDTLDLNESEKCIENETQLSYKEKLILWSDIEEIKLHTKPKELALIFHTGKVLELPCTYENWFVLVQQIPEPLVNPHKENIKTMFENFTLCPVCGVYSFDKEDDKCYCCRSWSEDIKHGYTSEEEAIFENQMDFLTENVDNETELNMNPPISTTSGFKYDENWKPIITEQEVLDCIRRYENN